MELIQLVENEVNSIVGGISQATGLGTEIVTSSLFGTLKIEDIEGLTSSALIAGDNRSVSEIIIDIII